MTHRRGPIGLTTPSDLSEMRESHRNERIVLATGCFDMLHAGHLIFLDEASLLGDLLVVGVNSDESVAAIKGHTRPIFHVADRSLLVSALRCVDAVFVFEEPSAERWIMQLNPDVFVTNEDSFDRYPAEREAALAAGCKIHLVHRRDGPSTTAVLTQVAAIKPHNRPMPQG